MDADRPPTRCKDPGEEDLGLALGYRFLSAAYRYPDAANLGAARELAAGLPDAVAVAAPGDGGGLGAAAAEAGRLLAGSARDLLEEQFVALFGHSLQSSCPPYEAEYGRRGRDLEQPHDIADIAGFYRAFGLVLGTDTADRPDFLPLELEFAAFLCLKASFAAEAASESLGSVCARARRRFLGDHLGRWLPAFAGRLLREADEGFYPAVTRLAEGFVAADCARLGIVPGAPDLSLAVPLEDPEDCWRCPMSTAHGTLREV